VYDFKQHDRVCTGSSSKRKIQNKENTPPAKKQKLSEEQIAYEVNVLQFLLIRDYPGI
jgi:hypothetical protein